MIRITRRRRRGGGGGGEGFGRGGTRPGTGSSRATACKRTCKNGPPRLELGRLFASTRVICRWDGGIGAFIGGRGAAEGLAKFLRYSYSLGWLELWPWPPLVWLKHFLDVQLLILFLFLKVD